MPRKNRRPPYREKGINVAITKSSFTADQPPRNPQATDTAEGISPPGVTRQERIANQVDAVSSSGAAPAAGSAFIDGSSIPHP